MTFVRIPPLPTPLPSEREATLRRVRVEGPKAARRVRPDDLGKGPIQTAEIENTIFTSSKPQDRGANAFSHPAREVLTRTGRLAADAVASDVAMGGKEAAIGADANNAVPAETATPGTEISQPAPQLEVESIRAPTAVATTPPRREPVQEAQTAETVAAVAAPAALPATEGALEPVVYRAPEPVIQAARGSASAEAVSGPAQKPVVEAAPESLAQPAVGERVEVAPVESALATTAEPEPEATVKETAADGSAEAAAQPQQRQGEPQPQSGLRPQTKSPAYVKAPAEVKSPQQPLSKPLPPRAQTEPAALEPGKLLSMRAMTLQNTEQFGTNATNTRVPSSNLPLSQRMTADIYHTEPFSRAPKQEASKGLVAGAISGIASYVSSLTTAAPSAAQGSGSEDAGFFPKLLPGEKLPSMREMTIMNSERFGTNDRRTSITLRQMTCMEAIAATAGGQQGAAAATTETTATGTVPASPSSTATATATTARSTAAGATALLSKPLSEWTREDVREAGRALLDNRLVLSVAAVAAAALTVFSVYRGAEMYNRLLLSRCLDQVERELPATVHLYIHKRSPLAPSVSVPCSWVETYLRVANVPYEAHIISDASVSPSGQLPFIIHRNARLAGATEIIEYVKEAFAYNIDAHLTAEQRATGVAMLSALEYSLKRGYTRSVLLDKPDVIRPYYSEINATPDWLTRFALSRMASRISARNKTTGYAYYTPEQADATILRDTVAFESLLASSNFLFSQTRPSSFDCALYAWLLPIVAMETSSSVNASFTYVVRSRVLVRFVTEMTAAAFPDFDDIVRNQYCVPDSGRGGAITDRHARCHRGSSSSNGDGAINVDTCRRTGVGLSADMADASASIDDGWSSASATRLSTAVSSKNPDPREKRISETG